MTSAATIQPNPDSKIGFGPTSPRFDRNIDSPQAIAFFGRGSGLSTAKYQKNNCSNNGILRRVSTYTAAIFAITKFFESLAMPTLKPNMVAKTIPIDETNKVLSTPTQNALK